MSEDSGRELWKYFLSGGWGGVCAVMCGHPLDTVKVRLQCSGEQGLLYKGILDCVRKTFREEGVKGFYRGMSGPLLSATPLFALGFFSYGVGKRLVQGGEGKVITAWETYLAGAMSGGVTGLASVPVERVKCVLQASTKRGAAEAVRQLIKRGGMRSLFAGTGMTLIRDVPATGIYFLSYESMKEYLGGGSTVLAGGFAGLLFWVVAMPADVVKTRIQASMETTSVLSVYRKLVKREGVKGLYTGFSPVLLRAFPTNAACFLGFESALSTLNYLTTAS